jgi:hypothetical protein
MKKHALVCNLMYKQDSYAHRGDLIGLLKYVQYRDDKDSHIPQDDGMERWYDRGLGNHYRAIAGNLMHIADDKTNTDAVLVRMMVVSPHPDLMAALPVYQRERTLRDLTDTMMERYFEACDLPVPEYAFVIHDPQTENGIQRLHSHVLFPATVLDIEGRRHYDLRRGQMPLFHEVRDQSITEVWTRLLGAERVAELDASLLTDTEKQQLAERAAQAAEQTHERDLKDEMNELDRWFGPRR